MINSLLEHDAKQAPQTGSAIRHDSVCADCLYARTGGDIRPRHWLLKIKINCSQASSVWSQRTVDSRSRTKVIWRIRHQTLFLSLYNCKASNLKLSQSRGVSAAFQSTHRSIPSAASLSRHDSLCYAIFFLIHGIPK